MVVAALDNRPAFAIGTVPVIDGFQTMRRCHGESRFAQLRKILAADRKARFEGKPSGKIAMSTTTPFAEELATWPYAHVYTAFNDIKAKEAPLHEHWNTIESVELLLAYNVIPFAAKITETPVMIALAAGDNITSHDLEVAAFNAIPNPNKHLANVTGVHHMSLYTSEDDLGKVGRAQAGLAQGPPREDGLGGEGDMAPAVLPSEAPVRETDTGSTAASRPPTLPGLFDLYRRMLLIRRAEERLARDFKAGLLPGPVHLSIGQEAVPVGVCALLGRRDWITGTHRGHGHFLAKGGDVGAMFAEIHGRATGACGGFGGSMHVTDVSLGMLGANGIVAGGIGLAAGAALAQKLDGEGGVAVAFFGDGAASEGVLAETLNIAALWQLPLIFVCENNGYCEFSPTGAVTAGEIVDRAKPYGVPAAAIDGNNVEAVTAMAGEMIERARAGGGPGFIEARTYRFHGHVEGESLFIKEKYRDEAEVSAQFARDPLMLTRAALLAYGKISDAGLTQAEAEISAVVDEAANRAVEAPWPSIERLRAFAVG